MTKKAKTLKNNPSKWQYFVFEVEWGKNRQRKTIDVLAPDKESANQAVGFGVDNISTKDRRIKHKKISSADLALRKATARKKPKREEITRFINDIARFVEGGVRISDALRSCARTAESPVFRGILGTIIVDMTRHGGTVSSAMAQMPFVFTDDIIAVFTAAEKSGSSASVYRSFGLRRRKQDINIAKIRGALWLPGLMAVMITGIVAFIGIFTIPSMIENFQSQGVDMPGPLMFILSGYAAFMKSYFGLPSVIAAIALPVIYHKKILGSWRVQKLILKIPFLRDVLHKVFFLQALNIFVVLLRSNAKSETLFNLAGKSSGSLIYQKFFKDVYEHVFSGESIPSAFRMEEEQIGKEGIIFSERLAASQQTSKMPEVIEESMEDIQVDLDIISEQLPKWAETAINGTLMVIIGGVFILILFSQMLMSSAISGQ